MKRLLHMVFVAVLAAIAVVSVVMILPAFHKYQSLRKRNFESQNELNQNKAECIRLRKKLNNLDNHTEQIERIAREKFNFCKKDELIIKFKKQ